MNPRGVTLLVYGDVESKLLTIIWKLSRVVKKLFRVLAKQHTQVSTETEAFEVKHASASQKLTIVLPSNYQSHQHRSSLPIIFIHYGNSAYLKYSLSQAKYSNPDSIVYLVGDESNDCYDFVQHHCFLDYFNEAAEFDKIYRHFNTTPYHYALFDFQRWFILKEFLYSNGLEKCLYLDSDTMLYADVTQEQKKVALFDFTLSYRICGCTFFLNRVKALGDFCQFLMDLYTKKQRYQYDKMISHYAMRQKNGLRGGVCDMTAFELYSGNHFGEIGEVALIIDGSVYDPNINLPTPGFEMSNGIKRIIWKDKVPYGKQEKKGKEIRFNSLHFQGREAKRLMGAFYTGTRL